MRLACGTCPMSVCWSILNADLLAAGISPRQLGATAVRSARLVLSRWAGLVKRRRDFAFEITLSGKTYAGMLGSARTGCAISGCPA